MNFFRKLLCNDKQEKQEENLKQQVSEQVKKEREKKQRIMKEAETLAEYWSDWPDRKVDEVNRTEKTESIEIPVYTLQVNYSNGETELLEHETFNTPDVKTIDTVNRLDIDKTSFRYRETKDKLSPTKERFEELASFNRDNVNSVKITEKNTRIIEMSYELVEIKETESYGSKLKRHQDRHIYRHPNPYVENYAYKWERPTNPRQLRMKIVDEHGLMNLLEKQTETRYEAEKIKRCN